MAKTLGINEDWPSVLWGRRHRCFPVDPGKWWQKRQWQRENWHHLCHSGDIKQFLPHYFEKLFQTLVDVPEFKSLSFSSVVTIFFFSACWFKPNLKKKILINLMNRGIKKIYPLLNPSGNIEYWRTATFVFIWCQKALKRIRTYTHNVICSAKVFKRLQNNFHVKTRLKGLSLSEETVVSIRDEQHS